MMKISKNQTRYNRYLALNGESMPEVVRMGGRHWQHLETFKHDFFAATGCYQAIDNEERITLKIFRPNSFRGLPFSLLSRWEARHVEKIYLKLQDTGHVPRWTGRYGKTGITHEFIPGQELRYSANIEPEFFDQLDELINTMHQRGISYVDTNKPDNILVGDDGKAYLIDFQITWHQPPFPLSLLTWPIFALFKNSDLYHMTKHRRNTFRDRIFKADLRRLRPWYIKLHRIIANPIRYWHRRYLRKVESDAEYHPEGHERH